MNTSFTSVNEYITSFPLEIQDILVNIRNIILDTCPDAEESISYGMPAYKYLKKPLVYFAANKSHIGFYATPTGHQAFEKELYTYKQGKGSVQFPYSSPMPNELIAEIVKFRMEENRLKLKKA